MTAWPSTLPQYIEQEGYSETPQDPVVRSNTDTGPQKSRLRFTAVTTAIQGMQIMTAAQAETLRNFWKTDCAYGAVSFTWVHPRTQVACTMKWKSPPVFNAKGAAFTATLSLEIQP